MKKIDIKSIECAGAHILDTYDWVVATAATGYEDYKTDLQITTTADTFEIEVKTIRADYNADSTNFRWHCPKPTGKWCIINKETKRREYNGSKWQKLMDGEYRGLCYVTREGLYLFSRRMLKEAYLGDVELYQTHTKELKDKSMSWELKAVVDLTKGAYIPCNPDPSIFA